MIDFAELQLHLFYCLVLADDRFDSINYRVGEESHQDCIQSEHADHFADIHLLIFAFQRNKNQTTDDQAAQLEEGEIRIVDDPEEIRNLLSPNISNATNVPQQLLEQLGKMQKIQIYLLEIDF